MEKKPLNEAIVVDFFLGLGKFDQALRMKVDSKVNSWIFNNSAFAFQVSAISSRSIVEFKEYASIIA